MARPGWPARDVHRTGDHVLDHPWAEPPGSLSYPPFRSFFADLRLGAFGMVALFFAIVVLLAGSLAALSSGPGNGTHSFLHLGLELPFALATYVG